jgi:hypothetical protein
MSLCCGNMPFLQRVFVFYHLQAGKKRVALRKI